MSRMLRAALLLAFIGCDEGLPIASGGGSCQWENGQACLDYVGPAWTGSSACPEQWQPGACDAAGRLGGCAYDVNNDPELAVVAHSFSPIDPAAAAAHCDELGGTWTPGG